MRPTLALRLLLVVGVLLAASLAATTFLAERAVKGPIIQNLNEKGTALVTALAASVGEAAATGDTVLLSTYVDQARRQPGVLYAIGVDADGRVLAHSDLTVARGSQPDDPLLRAALGSVDVRITEHTHDGIAARDFAAPLVVGGKRLGAVRLGLSRESERQAAAGVRRSLILVSLAVLAAALLGAYGIARWIVAPLARLTRAVESVARGDLEVEPDVRSRDEIGQLADRFRHMIGQLRAGRTQLLAQQQMRDELEVAQRIQQTLLPRETPYLEGYEIAAHYVPAKDVSGDYFDIFWVDANRLGIAVADVCGKGVPAALLMVSCRAELRYQARGEVSPAVVVRRVNRAIAESTGNGKTFVTLLYAVLDLRLRTLTFANAGHTPLYVVNPAAGRRQLYGSQSLPLGTAFTELFEKQIQDEQVPLGRGDLAFFYTDGLSELGRPDTAPAGWDEAHVYRRVDAHATEPVAQLLLSLQADADRALAGAAYTDDLTMVALRVTG